MDKMKPMNASLINGLNRIEGLIPSKTAVVPKEVGEASGGTFKDVLNGNLVSGNLTGSVNTATLSNVNSIVKDNTLKKVEFPAVKFSNHAIERMQSRGISYSPEDITKLSQAVQKAAAKGSKDTLVLMDHSALIVSVKNNTVVTVMDKNALKENVFTNIDSTIVM